MNVWNYEHLLPHRSNTYYIFCISDAFNDSSTTMKAVMMERTVAKATCGVTSVSHRGVHHRVARSSMGIEKSLVNGVRQGRMVAMQAKKAPELPPVVSPTQGEVSQVEISDLINGVCMTHTLKFIPVA